MREGLEVVLWLLQVEEVFGWLPSLVLYPPS
jgi:hypothetical protein